MYQYVGVRVDRLDADTRWEELADYVVPEEAFTSALEWCKLTEDVTLRKQLTFLHSIVAVVITYQSGCARLPSPLASLHCY